MQTDPIDDRTLIDGTGSLVTYLAVSGTVDAFYLKGDGSQITNISNAALPSGVVSSSAQTIGNLIGTNIVSGSGQRFILGLATTDSPTFANLTLTGNLTAQQLIISSSVFVVTQSYSSGSTAFGDTLEDFHQFTGSVYITSSLTTTGTGIFQGTSNSSEYILRIKGKNTGSQLAIGVSGDGNYGIQNSVLNYNGTDYRKYTLTANGIYFNIVSGAFQQQNALRINGDGTTRIHEIWTDNYVNAPGLENTDPNGFAELDWYYGGEFADVIARRTGVTIDTGDNDTTYTWKFDNSGSLFLPFTSSNNIYNSDGTVWTASYSTTAKYAENLIGTGPFATTGSNIFDGNQFVNGNVVVDGTLTAQTYVVSSSIINIQTVDISGSTVFGDTPEDTHQFTGSLLINGAATSSLGFYGNLTGTASAATLSSTSSYLDPLFISASVAYYGFAGASSITWNNILFKPSNLISGSGQRNILGLGENDSPRFSTIYATNANLDGNLLVDGTITARTYVISSSVVNYETINVSGSTIFGNSSDDTHQFTGSILTNGQIINTDQTILGPPALGGTTDRITLWDNGGSPSSYRYSLGIESNHLWTAVDVNDPGWGFKWYAGGVEVARLDGIGNLNVSGSITSSTFRGNLIGTSSWSTNALTASYAMNAAGFASGSFATTGSNTFTGNQNYANNSVIGDTTYSTLGGNPINLYYGISKGDIANRFGGIKISNYDWSGGNLASKFEIYTDSEAQDFSTRRFLVDGFGNININANTEITGNLVVTGKLTAQEFHTEIVSASIIYESGSTKFGDTLDDIHQFTGSLYVTGALVIPTVQTLSPSADVGSIVINNNNLYIYF
jgi:hypothetical protein